MTPLQVLRENGEEAPSAPREVPQPAEPCGPRRPPFRRSLRLRSRACSLQSLRLGFPRLHPLRRREPSSRREKANTAKEVAAQTAAVTAEIRKSFPAERRTISSRPLRCCRRAGKENYAETGAELRNNSRRLAETLASFGVDAKAGGCDPRPPSVTRYEFTLDQGG